MKSSPRRFVSVRLPLFTLALITPLGLLNSTGVAHAQLTLLTSPTQLGAGVVSFNFPGTDGTSFNSPYTLSAGTFGTLTFTDSDHFERQDENGFDPLSGTNYSGGYSGDFNPGTHLMRNVGSGAGAATAMHVAFSQAINQFGFEFDPVAGTVNFTLSVYENNGLTPVATYQETVTQTNSGSSGSGDTAGFFGVHELGGNKITGFMLQGDFPSPNPIGNAAVHPNDFAMGPISLGRATVPEPTPAVILTAMAIPVSWLGLRRKSLSK